MPTVAVIAILTTVWALPSALAIVRKHPSWLQITILDVVLGWTIVGWVAALLWVLRPVKARAPRKPRKVRIKKTAKARSARETAAANDNASATMHECSHAMPAALDSDAYEEWLEGGSALLRDDASQTPPEGAYASAKPQAAA